MNKTKENINNLSKSIDWLKSISEDELRENIFDCIIDGHHGVYVPQTFAQKYPQSNIDKETWDILLGGPDDESYQEAWGSVVNEWENGHYRLDLGESGDLFLYHAIIYDLWESVQDVE